MKAGERVTFILQVLALVSFILGIGIYFYVNRYDYELSTKQWAGKEGTYVDHKPIRFDRWTNRVEIYLGYEGVETRWGTEYLDLKKLKTKWADIERWDAIVETLSDGGEIEKESDNKGTKEDNNASK